MMRAAVALGLVACLAALAAACGGGSGDKREPTDGSTPVLSAAPSSSVTPVVISSDVVVGPNRFLVGLLGAENEIITDAQASFRFFQFIDGEPKLRMESQATVIRMTRAITRDLPNGSRTTEELGETAAYAAELEFSEAGDWGVEVMIRRGSKNLDPVGALFTVAETSQSVAVGEPAPKSHQLTLADVANLSEIDTSDPPDPEWHQMTIADAVTSGKPVAIAFATPGFCQTQMCAPMTGELAMLYHEYKNRVTFIHVEPYDLHKARSGEGLVPVPATSDWGLDTEPWVFVVDAEGRVAAKFEAFVMMDEVEAAFRRLLGDEPSSGMEG